VPGEIWALNPDTGRMRWLAETRIPGNISPSVVQGAGLVYVFGGYPTRGTVAIRTGGSRDVTDSHQVWRISKTTYVPTPIFHAGHLYFVNDQGFAFCIRAATGEIIYEERLPGLTGGRGRGGRPVYASAVLANGNYYATTRQAGTCVIAAQPKFDIVATNQIGNDDSQFNATPAISGSEIFLRSDSHLHCFSSKL
jgi:outer membrane protein assembly factor BamB